MFYTFFGDRVSVTHLIRLCIFYWEQSPEAYGWRGCVWEEDQHPVRAEYAAAYLLQR